MNQAIDFSTLTWVKNELDATLKEARQSLEAHVENPQDDAQLGFLTAHLHQVYGTLHMVELYGASLLAEEMEQVARGIAAGTVSQHDDACDVLMRAILQLPDYLDRLIAGYRDIPLVLLPLLNDLRAVRGENLLSENHMFSPDLDAAVPESIITPGTDGNGDIKAQALRHRFQLGLLGWFRGSGTQDALASMSGVLESLQNQSGDAGAARLWWVAAGIVDALRTETLESSIAVKRLMGQVDRQIKSVMDHGESFLTRNMPRDLFKNLLFYAGQAHGAGPRVAEIQSTYKLQDLLPGDEELAAARESMAGQNADLFATVAVAVKEELGRLKDTLDIVLRNGCREINELQPLADSLCSLGDTLGMLSLGAAREAVTSKSADLQRSIDAQEIPADTSLMDVASTLLFVESSVDGMGCGRAVADSGGKVEEQLARSEYNQVMDVVIQEAITDLLRAKEAIIAYIDSDNDTSALSEVPQWFNQVKGGLLLLGESRPAALVGSISRYIEKELVESNKQAPQQELDSLADAVCGLEYYLESRKEHRMYGSSAMSVAEESIDKLGYPALEDESAETVMEVEAAAAAPDTTETDLVESVGEAAENLAEETTLSAPPAEPASHQADDQGEELSVIGKEVDEEILEIFIEEAEEELASINELLPAWISDHDNTEAMSSMRRSWHTLKGSGRLVGALRIGELAWAYENLLNRIIDGVVPVTPELTGLLQSAAEMLPQLVQEVRDGTPVQGSVSDLMSGAAALSSGKSPSATSASDTQRAPEVETLAPEPLTEPDFVPEAITPPVEAAAVADEEHSEVEEVVCNGVMDSMLYEIFNTEARGHLEVIREFLNQAALGDSMISEPLARALHTLHGSAHMAEAGIIADLAGALERWVKALMGAGQPLADDGRDVLTESVDIIDQMLSSLPGAISGPDRYEGLLQQINSLWEAVPVPAMDEIVMRSEAEPAAGMDNEPEDLYASCDDELLEVFIEESADNLETGGAALLRWCKSREDSEALAELQRALHTVKGGARIADITPMGDLAHAMESLVTVIAECKADTADSALDGVQDAQDSMVAMLESVRSRQSVESAYALINRLQELSERIPVADTAEAAVDETIEEPAMEEMVPAVAAEAVHAADDPYAETDQELLEVFLEEASDIMENSEQTLQNWKNTPDDKSFMTEFQRELHTLKGGARMADITEIGDLAHAVESLMVKVSEGAVAAGESMFMVLHQAHDCLSGMVDQVRNRQSLEQATAVLHDLELLTEGKDVVAQTANRKKAARKSTRSVALQGEKELEDRRTHSRTNHELVRVKATLLDNMVNFAGEVSIYRSRLEQQVGAYRFNLAELDQTVSRVREQLRKLDIETEAQVLFRYESEVAEGADDEEFDPLEMDRYSHMQQLSRSLAESVNDLGSLQGMLENITRESETLLLQQSRVNTELQEGLMRTRMVPFLSLAARMRRIVRQTANELGRKAELELSGAEGEMDRTVVDRIVAPLEHMLRNAISHGIESPEQRKKAGKKACGTINITLQRESSDVVLRISDDGAGIKMDAIRSKAVERGLMKADSDLTDNEVLQFILETGFSTAEKITQVAGRGVGMDVVNSEVKQLGGSLHIDSEPLKGTTFTIRLPFTLALNQALLIEVGEDPYAIPLSSIEGIVRMKREDLKAYYTDPEARFSYGGFEYEVRHLGSVLGTGSPHLDSGPSRAPVLLSRVGDHGVAFQVENLMGSREIVVKSVGPQISTVRGVSGATILGDGRVVMILDITAMLRSGVVDVMDQVEDMIRQPKAVETLTVMVVDDSITVRKVTTRLLERNDMNVITAKDGVDAVAKLQEHVPDIMLLDIEMPRMDGFELATHVRNEARLRDIPIIMITSRTGDKHRQRAMQIGVNRYLGKPFQESELLENIKGLLEEPGVDG